MSKIDWNSYFYYDESSPSCLRWKVDAGAGVLAGDNCGYTNSQGYWSVMLYGKNYLQHRVIYEMLNGVELENLFIDHIDGVRNNNILSNLRVVTKAVNNRNSKMNKNNTSGSVGVYSSIKCGRKYWVAKWRHLESKQKHKYFAVDVYGEEQAKIMAEIYRKDKLEELNEIYGFMYSDRHIQGDEK
jgi:hypothetical protein